MTQIAKQNFISGQWQSGEGEIENINPSDTDDIIDRYSVASVAQVKEAVASANEAADVWAEVSPEVRADCLKTIADEIMSRADELGDLLAREEGKTIAEAKGEVGRAARVFQFYAGEAIRVTGENVASVRPNVDVEITHEAVGTVGMITPWNFPIAIPAWKIAPALAYGNCVVFKPAELVPGSAWALSEIISRVGLPDGVFNLTMGPGRTVGDAIINADGVDAVTFTGSDATGKMIRTTAAERGARVQTEMGGKNPLVVMNDTDLNVAVNTALNGAFFSTGQRCTASSRLIVEAGIYDKFVDALSEAMKNLVVGDARDTSTQVGPVVSATQQNSIMEAVERARTAGAEIIGGEPAAAKANGYYLRPSLVLNTSSSDQVNRDEIFGPVASILKADDLDHAITLANDTQFGLSAGICTTSLFSARHFKRKAKAGMVMVNLPTAGVDYHVPFGGIKGSSYGPREQGSYAKQFYTNVKTTYITA
ncbi:MAG: aldehyde dehydrogenase family protein [Pseudomonadota bacterium]